MGTAYISKHTDQMAAVQCQAPESDKTTELEPSMSWIKEWSWHWKSAVKNLKFYGFSYWDLSYSHLLSLWSRSPTSQTSPRSNCKTAIFSEFVSENRYTECVCTWQSCVKWSTSRGSRSCAHCKAKSLVVIPTVWFYFYHGKKQWVGSENVPMYDNWLHRKYLQLCRG